MNSILEGMGFGVGFAFTYWFCETLKNGTVHYIMQRRNAKATRDAAKYISAQDASKIKAELDRTMNQQQGGLRAGTQSKPQ